MVILMDIDNVINNFAKTLLAWHNRAAVKESDIHTLDEINTYNWFVDTYGDDAWKPTERKEFWNDIEINADMARVAFWCKQNGHAIYFVTASHYNLGLPWKIKAMLEGINKYNPHGDEDNSYPNPLVFSERDIIISERKWLISGDVLIDDCYANCEQYSDYAHGTAILINRPWNHSNRLLSRMSNYKPRRIIDASSANEVKTILKTLALKEWEDS